MSSNTDMPYLCHFNMTTVLNRRKHWMHVMLIVGGWKVSAHCYEGRCCATAGSLCVTRRRVDPDRERRHPLQSQSAPLQYFEENFPE
jgi:hypothetical protein